MERIILNEDHIKVINYIWMAKYLTLELQSTRESILAKYCTWLQNGYASTRIAMKATIS